MEGDDGQAAEVSGAHASVLGVLRGSLMRLGRRAVVFTSMQLCALVWFESESTSGATAARERSNTDGVGEGIDKRKCTRDFRRLRLLAAPESKASAGFCRAPWRGKKPARALKFTHSADFESACSARARRVRARVAALLKANPSRLLR